MRLSAELLGEELHLSFSNPLFFPSVELDWEEIPVLFHFCQELMRLVRKGVHCVVPGAGVGAHFRVVTGLRSRFFWSRLLNILLPGQLFDNELGDVVELSELTQVDSLPLLLLGVAFGYLLRWWTLID